LRSATTSSVTADAATPSPRGEGGPPPAVDEVFQKFFDFVGWGHPLPKPIYGWLVIHVWLAGQQEAHLCTASGIRAMPENEISPAMRGALLMMTV